MVRTGQWFGLLVHFYIFNNLINLYLFLTNFSDFSDYLRSITRRIDLLIYYFKKKTYYI